MQPNREILISMMARALVVAIIASIGCGRQLNPAYCFEHPEDGDCRDAGLVSFDAPGPECSKNEDCTEPGKTVCDVSVNACVQCLPNVEPTSCSGATPVCGEDRLCHGCIVDTHCAESFVCTPSGTCANSANVLYAKPGGAGDCSRANACSFTTAVSMLSTTKYIVKLTTTAGTSYSEPPITIGVTGTQPVQVLGVGTTFTPAGDGDAINTTGGNVELVGFTITNATGANSEAVECTGGGRITLRRMALTNSAAYGLRTTGCFAIVERSTLSGNPLGAMRLDTGDVQIRNNFLVNNGTDAVVEGNVVLRNVAGRFIFNTVASNSSKNGNNTSGISCSRMGGAMMTVNRNIIAGNGGANNATSGDCAISTATNYIDNTIGGLGFVSPTDFHLTVNSPPNTVLNDPLADADCKINDVYIDDVDGQPRPVMFCDRGADEYRP